MAPERGRHKLVAQMSAGNDHRRLRPRGRFQLPERYRDRRNAHKMRSVLIAKLGNLGGVVRFSCSTTESDATGIFESSSRQI